MLQKHQNLDPVIRQLKTWHKYKTKPLEADTTILGNKTHLRYFRNFNNTSFNENTDILEYQKPDIKKPCLPLSMMLIAFHTSHSLHTKRHSGATFLFLKCSNLTKSILQRLHNMSIKQTISKLKTNRKKNKILKHKIYFSITELLLIQKDQYHHPQKETHI